ncbi:hypothetical protein DFH08DRAFT_797006 [Mycena albidolilacea]|uniref:Uncharacterized protein n=1 Tax=Mycena albidolilacea TaxID=1033008 RepID=A0AAD7AWW1_9AGAR|nr:hypothetical protein DFH08DRAFT_797006 [Mycena albidolilacea]
MAEMHAFLPPLHLPLLWLPLLRLNKIKLRACRDRRRELARAVSENPLQKAIHRKRVLSAKTAALELEVDATELKHSTHAWQGSAATGKEAFMGTQGFMYINWLGRLTIPLLDAQCRVIAVLGGMPRDHTGWKTVTDGAAALLEERQSRIKLTTETLHHWRALDEFPAIALGVAHGGGRMEPGEVYQNDANTQLTDELLVHDYTQRILASALVQHSNVPIRTHEKRSPITQYTAGGLFRWVRNGCKTDTAFQCSASEEKAARSTEHAQRWEEGVKMFSVVDNL